MKHKETRDELVNVTEEKFWRALEKEVDSLMDAVFESIILRDLTEEFYDDLMDLAYDTRVTFSIGG